ncbi:hypothetical protein B296_00018035 [Ensete ventricosum]|uniref:Uncharacterized protein n=1 Tax=Ensete ventricosum TaxID=4639 RepID=A0A426YGZ3_ENSVE|nr:hypothetical protein B296_00018035 [Ensete ventricosum]
MERFPSPTPRARSFLRCPFFLLMTEIADPATPDLRTDLGKLTSLQVLDLVDYSVIFGARLCFTLPIKTSVDGNCSSLMVQPRSVEIEMHKILLSSGLCIALGSVVRFVDAAVASDDKNSQ